MSDLLQAGQHPDADQLNAFVEHTLPAHERQQTLAHLAVCPACRQIVALSLPPVDKTPTWELEAVRRRWSPRWYPAWVVIPAIAALILVVLYVHNERATGRYTSVLSQMADARPSAPAPPPAASTQPEATRPPAPLALNANRNRVVTPPRQLPPVMQSSREPGGASGSAGGVMGGVLGGIGSLPTQPPAPAFAASSASAGGPVTALAVDRLSSAYSTPGPLPSRLAILSMASRGNQRIAIDTDRHVFFSEDGGKNWKSLASPWKGRPVSVVLASAVTFGSVRASLKISSHPAATTSATLSGTVRDPAGAVISGATLTASNSSGVLVGSATTDSHGQYRMEALAPGSYGIVAQASGFETQSFAAQARAAQQAVADVTLRPGSATQTVSIEASPAFPDTSSAGANRTATPAIAQPTSRFELTTDDGERWTSTDGQTWVRK